MEDKKNEASKNINLKRADSILNRIDLSWKDIEGKNVLDIASGDSAIAKAAENIRSTANITSVDLNVSSDWLKFPWQKQQPPIQTNAESLPFKDLSFDYVIMHASPLNSSIVNEADRVLRPGGEIRIYPMGGVLLEYSYIFYYLENYKGISTYESENIIGSFDKQIDAADGRIPTKYYELRDVAENSLTKEDKLEVINTMANQYSSQFGLNFSYKVLDPEEREPSALLIYRKI